MSTNLKSRTKKFYRVSNLLKLHTNASASNLLKSLKNVNEPNESKIYRSLKNATKSRTSDVVKLLTSDISNLFNPYHAKFLKWNNPSYIFGIVH